MRIKKLLMKNKIISIIGLGCIKLATFTEIK